MKLSKSRLLISQKENKISETRAPFYVLSLAAKFRVVQSVEKTRVQCGETVPSGSSESSQSVPSGVD